MSPRVNRNIVAYLIDHLVLGMENHCVSFKKGTSFYVWIGVSYNVRKHVFVEIMSVLLLVRLEPGISYCTFGEGSLTL